MENKLNLPLKKKKNEAESPRLDPLMRALKALHSAGAPETMTEEELEEKYQEMAALYGMTVPQLREQVPPARLQHDLKLAKARAVVVDSALRK